VGGKSQSYSFWSSATEVPTSLFGLNDKCENCDGNVTLIVQDASDGKYYTVGGDKTPIDSLLNAEADKNGYKKRWSHSLSLESNITIHIGSPLNVALDVLNGTTLEEITILKQYLDSPKTYAIGDIRSNAVLTGKSVVTEDMEIIVMDRNGVAIDMEKGKVVVSDVDTTELANSISAISGVDTKDILIDVEVENGYVLRVIVILSSSELTQKVIASVNNLVNDEHCNYGILCRSQRAYLLVEDQFLSGSDNLCHSFMIFAFIFMMFMRMMQ